MPCLPLCLSRALRLSIGLLATGLGGLPLSGAAQATAPSEVATDPGAATAASVTSTALPNETVFIVFDIDLESAGTATAPSAAALESQRLRAYDDLTRRLQAWGATQGVAVQTGVYARNRKIDLRGRSYDHLIVEKITQQAQADSATGPRVSNRRWSVTGYDVRPPNAKQPKQIGSADFVSDGVACFGLEASALGTAQRACQQAYLRLLSSHLQWINPAWPDIEPGTP